MIGGMESMPTTLKNIVQLRKFDIAILRELKPSFKQDKGVNDFDS